MLLSDRDIRTQLDSGRIVLDPYDPAMIQPSSIDVRLDRFFRLFDNHKYAVIDPAEDQPDLTRLVEPDGDEPFVLHPGEFVLGSTYEAVTLPDDVAARLEGKSSLGRLGLLTHSTAGFIDPGFTGHVTLELSNVATLPIKLWPGMKIGQLCFFRLSSPAERPLRVGGVRVALPGPAWADRVALVPELPPHARSEGRSDGRRGPVEHDARRWRARAPPHRAGRAARAPRRPARPAARARPASHRSASAPAGA